MPPNPTPAHAMPPSTGMVHWVVALALVSGFVACQKRDAGVGASPISTRNDAAQPDPAATQKLELDGFHVQVSFPGFRLLEGQSDPSAGMLAFAPEHPSPDRTASLFLDGSRSATMPKSAAEALASVLADDVCRAAGDCRELGHASLPNDGLLITVRKPHAVYTEVWRHNAQQRVVRCGAELSELGTSSSAGKRWLDDGAALRAAQNTCESLCRSVIPLP